jgi:hypothetical protein
MPSYTLSSLPENRECLVYSDHICPTYPCIHTPCHDPDYLDNLEDFAQDQSLHRLIWNLHRMKDNPTQSMENLIHTLDPELLKTKLERCQRIEEKTDRINRDKVNYRRQRQLWLKERQALYEQKRKQREEDVTGLKDKEEREQNLG